MAGIKLANGTVVQVSIDSAVADTDAVTAAAVAGTIPAGGTGDAAGGWDTAEHRNTAISTVTEMIVTVNALVDDVAAIRTKQLAILSALRSAKLIET